MIGSDDEAANAPARPPADRLNAMIIPGARGTRGLGIMELLWATLWFAVVVGGLQALTVHVRRLDGVGFEWTSREVVWMAPLAYLVTFLPFALMFAIGSRIFPGRSWRGVAIGVLATLGALALSLLLVPRIHWVAQWVLSIGVGAQVARVVSAHPAVAAVLFRRGGIALALALAALGAGLRAWRGWAERRAMSALPDAPVDAPNVLFIIFDTMRAAHSSAYGYPRRTTPVLDSLAREGVLFEWAFSPSAWTLTSHGSMFTGWRAGALSGDWHMPLDDAAPTLAEVLRARGYRTAGFVSNVYYAGWESGLDRGFLHYEDFRTTPNQVIWSSMLSQTAFSRRLIYGRSLGALVDAVQRFDWRVEPMLTHDRKEARHLTDDVLRWHDAQAPRPFFYFLNYYESHKPYYPHRYATAFDSGATPIDRYDAGILYQDDEAGRLLRELDRRGALRNTIIVLTADHGEHFGEHGIQGHGASLYQELIRVPLVIVDPRRVPAGRRIATPVSLTDIAATVLDLAGIGGAPGLPGHSLAAFWTGGEEPVHWSPVLAEMGPDHPDSRDPKENRLRKAVIDAKWYYIRDGEGREELFDYRVDPSQNQNLAAAEQYRAVVASMRQTLDSLLRHP